MNRDKLLEEVKRVLTHELSELKLFDSIRPIKDPDWAEDQEQNQERFDSHFINTALFSVWNDDQDLMRRLFELNSKNLDDKLEARGSVSAYLANMALMMCIEPEQKEKQSWEDRIADKVRNTSLAGVLEKKAAGLHVITEEQYNKQSEWVDKIMEEREKERSNNIGKGRI